MKRSISTLLTTLLFSAAIVPHAMAQMQPDIPASSASDSTMPTSTKPEVLPESPASPTPNVSTNNADKSRASVDRPSVDNSYPGYCPALPPGTQPGDWDYREALEKCLYGS